ncbi:photosystem II reaction center PsbP [Spirulina sp. CS-785/01]|uniref:photosystem II reaction center PsbP n=1 Tax=Spirulina sp. CS-785/01 TaxID=3021716 RepID=UPI00232D73EF|nr:photosystem II reaction center PsbP [Spirulina sp. CS-785/01]MDB9313069.1 photosystem II reaction center PsbP [Spirulina sp. CS-785/01]
MGKSLLKTLLIAFCLVLTACSAASNLQSFTDSRDGYRFLYPNGWVEVDVKNATEGVDVVFRDLVERTENLSVIISEIPEDKSLSELGTPSEVGYRFLKSRQNDDSDREAEFLSADSREGENHEYYILEYAVTLPNQQQRHNIASVAVSRGKLFTFNLSTSEQRWQQVREKFNIIVRSFSVY